MSSKKNEIRTQRSSALADKKRRLEELKARRSTRQLQQQQNNADAVSGDGESSSSASISASSAVIASKSGNLDAYIDDLLKSSLPKGASIVSPYATPGAVASTSNTTNDNDSTITPLQVDNKKCSVSGVDSQSIQKGVASKHLTEDLPQKEQEVQPQVETFEIYTQTTEEDFPLPLVNEEDDNFNEKKKEGESKSNEDELNNSTDNNIKGNDAETNEDNIDPPKLLNETEINEKISSKEFTSFFNSASKKVERYLGSSILSDLLVDDVMYYTDLQSKYQSNRDKKTSSTHSLITAQVSFEYPKWTYGRNVTCLDWSMHHRGEVMLASYHMPSTAVSSSSIGSTATSSIAPNTTPSSSLLPKSRSELTQADGLNILWNLTMPNRPEHILTCGSPVLQSKFHPTEGHLVVGACYSGQVVVWDVRSGRLPVQRSSLNLHGGGSSGNGGHVHPVVGMEVLDGGSGFVTAASDGTVKFWSLSNLIEPAESLKIPNANLTSIAVAPESQSIIAGDECGSMYSIISSSVTNAGGGGRSTSTSTSSSSRRAIRKLNHGTTTQQQLEGNDSFVGHYGPITGLSTQSKADGVSSISLSRGFARGSRGMVLTCGVDWTTKLWAPAYSEKPLLSLLSHSYDYMCDVQWSPIHPSVFATASSNGRLGFWNLSSSLDDPITGQEGIAIEKEKDSLSSSSPSVRGINRLKWSADGRRIAAACADSVHVLGLSEELWKPNGDEGTKLMNNLKSRGFLRED